MDRTSTIKKRYDRISRIYGLMDRSMGSAANKWRSKLFSMVQGPKVLEVGVGTGANLPYYPGDLKVTGIDFSPGMLHYAREKAQQLGSPVELLEMNVESLEFPDNTFDTVLTTCVFCSVPNAVKGLQEIHRVLQPEGRLVMLEHVLSRRPGIRQLMNILNPVTAAVSGANINRETGSNLEKAGFYVEEEDLWLDILKLFQARPMKA